MSDKKKYKYKSGLEQKIADSLASNKMGFKYEEERIPYVVPEKKKNYIPDFVLDNGIIVEGKGKLDRDTREKMALVIEQNPDKDIRFLFMRDNKITKTSKTRYSDWCKKRGIKYAVSDIGSVPVEWCTERGSGKLDKSATAPRKRTAKRNARSLSEGQPPDPDVQDG